MHSENDTVNINVNFTFTLVPMYVIGNIKKKKKNQKQDCLLESVSL